MTLIRKMTFETTSFFYIPILTAFMRTFLLFLFLTLFSFAAVSQRKISAKKLAKHRAKKTESKSKGSIVVSLDTIFNKGIAYAILKEKKQLPFNEYTLFSLNRETLILITPHNGIDKEHTPFYEFYFTESDRTAEMEKYYGLKLEKEIIENELIKDNKIDVPSEMNFLLKYPCRFSDTTIKQYITNKPPVEFTKDNLYHTVKRNRGSKIYFRDGKILQDYKQIGYYKIIDSVLRFYLPNNMMVAEAIEKENGVRELMTMKDRKIKNLDVIAEKEIEQIVSYLCEANYL